MDAKTRRKLYREEVRKAQEESYTTKDDSGKFKSVFRDIPGGLWKCKEGSHSINILPFIAGKNNPNRSEGKPTYLLDIFIHTKVGVNEDSYLCLNRTYKGKKDCPICEYQAKLRKQEEYDEAEVKALSPTRRAVYNIQVLDDKKESDRVRVFDVSHYLFEKELIERAEGMKGGRVLFAHPDEGKVITFKRRGKGPTDTKYAPFDFEPREEEITDELLDKVLCLDDYLIIPTYEEVAQAFFGKEESGPLRKAKNEQLEEEPPVKQMLEEEVEKEEKVKTEGKLKEEEGEVGEFMECPYGYEFAVDIDSYDECLSCEVYGDCLSEYEAIQADKEERRKSRAAAKESAKPTVPRRSSRR